MKGYDFGQFLYNSAFLDESQLAELIVAAQKTKATLATKAIFLRMVSVSELKELQSDESLEDLLRSHDAEVQGKYDEIVKKILKAGQSARLEKSKEVAPISLVQVLIDRDVLNCEQLEKFLDDYQKQETSPIEQAFAARYDSLPPTQQTEYSLAVDVVKSFCEFTSEAFSTSIILLPDAENVTSQLLGATVKIKGITPIVIGVFAEEPAFMKFAQNYNHLAENKEDALDVVSEFLNIYVGHFTIRVAETLGTEEEPETPRFGEVTDFSAIKMLADCGEIYLYVGNEECFDNGKTQAEGLATVGDLSQFGLEDLGIDLDDDFKDPYDF